MDEILGVNLKAPILMLAMLDKKKKINKCGSVVMMSSIASFHATVAHSLYGATKGGIKSFVQGAALDLAGKKIRVNAIAPGMVNTPLINFSALTEEQLKTNEENAYKLGAVKYVTLDVTQEYYEKSLKYMVYGNVLRNNCYPISVSSERIFDGNRQT